jgi:transposase
MLEALITGERDPLVLAEMARASMRAKRQILAQALSGRFTDHHAFLARTMLDRIDAVTATEARPSQVAHAHQRRRLPRPRR